MSGKISESGWNMMLLGDLLESLESGGRPKGGVRNIVSGIPSVGAEHLNSSGGFDFSEPKFIQEQFYDKLARGKLRVGDVLVVKDGATTGKVAIVDEDFPHEKAAVNEHVFILRPDKEKILAEFLFFYVYSPYGQAQIRANFHGSAQGGINSGFVSRFWVPLPSIEVQKRISTILEKARVLKNKREKTNQMTNRILQAALQKMFGDLDQTDFVRLGDVCDVMDVDHKMPKSQPTGIPFVSVKDLVNRSRIDFTKTKFITQEDYDTQARKCSPRRNDVLFGRIGTIGIARLVRGNRTFGISYSLCIVRPSGKVLPEYLESVMNSQIVRRQAGLGTKSIAVPDLGLKQIKNFLIPLPPLDRQRNFAEIADKVYSVTQKQQESRSTIDRLFAVLMLRSLKGELVS